MKEEKSQREISNLFWSDNLDAVGETIGSEVVD